MMHNAKLKPYLRQFYRGNRLAYAAVLLATALISAVNLATAWVMQQMFDSAAGQAELTPWQLLWMVVGILVAIAAIKGLAYLSRPRFMRRAMEQYKGYVFDRLSEKSIAAFTQESSASYLSALSQDATTIENGFLEQSFDLLFNLVLLVGSLGMMLWYSPLLTAIAIALSLLPAGAALLSGARMAAVERSVSDRNADFLSTLNNVLSGFGVVKSFRAEGKMAVLFRRSDTALEGEKCRKRGLGILLGALGGTASVSAQFGTILVGIFLIGAGFPLTPGMLIIFADLVGNVIRPINDLPAQLAARKAALGLIAKVADALEANVREAGAAELPALVDGITLEGVSFAYEAGTPVLEGLDMRFEAGKRYCIVGGSGSGKSTMLNLLMAAHGGYGGRICYDGVELREIASESLYGAVSLIGQNVFIFNATVRENITMFADFPDEAVERAIALSGVSSLIAERGEDYACGEGGAALSGGERQRIAIARALLRQAQVLLVDEATAALDAATAHAVSSAILALEGMTRIVVTHRLEASLLGRYDCILAMRGGRVVECGAFDELIERKGYFYSLYTVAQ